MNIMETRTVPMETLMEVISLQLAKGGKANLTVTGNSMAPMLHHHRDGVMLIPVQGKQKKGAVILYRRENGKYILHRIVSVTENGYICCGDNQHEKESVAQAQLVAVMGGFQRNGKAYTLDHLGYQIYRVLWTELFFLRPAYIAVRRSVGRILRRLRNLKSNRNNKQEVK